MKKLFFFASAAALIASSCSDDFGYKDNSSAPLVDGNCRILATYQFGEEEAGTRTELANNANKTYQWSYGDAIGLFNAAQASGKTNAMFAYKGPLTVNNKSYAEFLGDLDALAGDTYYGYYPYSINQQLNNGIIPLYISANQNFNHNQNTGDYYKYLGSFSQGADPAIAIGSLVTPEGEDAKPTMALDFYPMASCIVVPVTCYTDFEVTSVTLTVTPNTTSDATPEVFLAGKINAPVEALATALADDNTMTAKTYFNNSPENLATLGIQPADALTGYSPVSTITLDCGVGITLQKNIPTNFWFVVPANLPVEGYTYTIQINNDDKNLITRSYVAGDSDSKTYVGYNGVKTILPKIQTDATYQSFEYNPGGGILIDSTTTFLEYANLVTYGSAAIYDWVQYYNAATTGSEKDNEVYQTLLQFTQLPKMLNFIEGKSLEDLLGVSGANEVNALLNPTQPILKATVIDNIDLTIPALTKEMGDKIGSGVWAPNLPNYFQFYSNFVAGSTGTMSSIGGQYPFTLSGINLSSTAGETEYPIIGGAEGAVLTVNGNGLFTGTVATAVANVENLQFNYINVNVANQQPYNNQSGYGFLTYYQPLSKNTCTFTNVNVGQYCDVVNGTSEVTNKAILGRTSTSYLSGNNYIVGTEGSKDYSVITKDEDCSLPFVYFFNVQDDFNFTGIYGPEEFKVISVTTTGVLLTISSEDGQANAASLLEHAEPAANVEGYSILDNGTPQTSYWTGTAFESAQDGTAENLAYLVQTPNNIINVENAIPFNMIYNLNLMGTYNNVEHNEWWATANYNGFNKKIDVAGSKDANTITNIWIAPQKGQTYNTASLTLLGWQGSVTGNVIIDNITINNNTENSIEGVSIAAIAQQSSISSANEVTVTGYTVNTKSGRKYNDEISVFGGLFTTASNLTIFGNSILNKNEAFENSLEGIKGGYWAGWLTNNVLLTSQNTTSGKPAKLNLGDVKPGAFGQVAVTIQVPAGFTGNAYVDLGLQNGGITSEEIDFTIYKPTSSETGKYIVPEDGWNLNVKNASGGWDTYEYDSEDGTFTLLP